MTQTFYQVWRFNPLKDQWFYYNHIPNATTINAVKNVLIRHKNGEFKGNQFKNWMLNDRFKIVRVEQTITDCEEV